MILADICVRRPVFATMLVGSLVVAGWFSYKSLTLDLFPKVDMPVEGRDWHDPRDSQEADSLLRQRQEGLRRWQRKLEERDSQPIVSHEPLERRQAERHRNHVTCASR
jgi:hypothetical protein